MVARAMVDGAGQLVEHEFFTEEVERFVKFGAN
jgi:hypothetical protein